MGPFRQFRGVPVTGAPVTAPAAATAAVSAGATSASTGTDALLVAVSLFFSLSLSFFFVSSFPPHYFCSLTFIYLRLLGMVGGPLTVVK